MYVTELEAQRILWCTNDILWDLVRSGDLKPVYFTSNPKFKREDIEELLRNY